MAGCGICGGQTSSRSRRQSIAWSVGCSKCSSWCIFLGLQATQDRLYGSIYGARTFLVSDAAEIGGKFRAYAAFANGRRRPLELGNLPGLSSVVGIQGLRLPPTYPTSPAYIGVPPVAGLVRASVPERWLGCDENARPPKSGQCGSPRLST